jgi:hypothetical protein
MKKALVLLTFVGSVASQAPGVIDLFVLYLEVEALN